MCQKCDNEGLLENVGKRVVCLASVDESTVLIYGRGVFEGVFLKDDAVLTDEDREKIRVHLADWDSPEQRRKRMMLGLVQSGGDMEALTELAAKMDAEAARPIDDRIVEVWNAANTVPRVRLDDGTALWAQEDTPLVFGPEETFEEFVAGRLVMEVPYLNTSVKASSEG